MIIKMSSIHNTRLKMHVKVHGQMIFSCFKIRLIRVLLIKSVLSNWYFYLNKLQCVQRRQPKVILSVDLELLSLCIILMLDF